MKTSHGFFCVFAFLLPQTAQSQQVKDACVYLDNYLQELNQGLKTGSSSCLNGSVRYTSNLQNFEVYGFRVGAFNASDIEAPHNQTIQLLNQKISEILHDIKTWVCGVGKYLPEQLKNEDYVIRGVATRKSHGSGQSDAADFKDNSRAMSLAPEIRDEFTIGQMEMFDSESDPHKQLGLLRIFSLDNPIDVKFTSVFKDILEQGFKETFRRTVVDVKDTDFSYEKKPRAEARNPSLRRVDFSFVVEIELSIVIQPRPANFEFSNLKISPVKVYSGENVTISADITNTGGTDGLNSVFLFLNRSAEDSKKVDVKVGKTKKVEFIVNKSTFGKYEVRLGNLSGEFTVVARPADFQISDLVIEPVVVKRGEKMRITAVVKNVGETSGVFKYLLEIGHVEDKEVFAEGYDFRKDEVRVDGGKRETVEFVIIKDKIGDYQVKFSNQDDDKQALSGKFKVTFFEPTCAPWYLRLIWPPTWKCSMCTGPFSAGFGFVPPYTASRTDSAPILTEGEILIGADCRCLTNFRVGIAPVAIFAPAGDIYGGGLGFRLRWWFTEDSKRFVGLGPELRPMMLYTDEEQMHLPMLVSLGVAVEPAPFMSSTNAEFRFGLFDGGPYAELVLYWGSRKW